MHASLEIKNMYDRLTRHQALPTTACFALSSIDGGDVDCFFEMNFLPAVACWRKHRTGRGQLQLEKDRLGTTGRLTLLS